MTAESASDRQEQWVLVVRRSFGIPDLVGKEDARRALIQCCQEQLEDNGWQGPARAIAEPMMDSLLAFGANGEFDDPVFPSEQSVSASPFNTRDAAHRLIDKGMTVVDPEHLVFDTISEYPPEVLAAAQRVLDRVSQYLGMEPFRDPRDVT